MRDFAKIVRRLEGLAPHRARLRTLGHVEGYPVFAARVSSDEGRPTVLVLGGTHGDEPASVEAALRFLERDNAGWLEQVQFEVIPCLNPYGHVHDTRHNSQDVDINWSYLRTDVPEVSLVKGLIEGRRFEAVIDLHEDWESPGFYLYELTRGMGPVGPGITEEVSRFLQINQSGTIEKERATDGVIHPNLRAERRRKGAGIPVALYRHHTDHLITTETPVEADLGTRVHAHLVAIDQLVGAHARAIASGRSSGDLR